MEFNRFRTLLLLSGVAGIAMLFQCQSNPTPPLTLAEAQQQVQAGLKRWLAGNQKNYFYWLTDSSVMGQQKHITAIQVIDGRVKRRYYKSFQRNHQGKVGAIEAWKEDRPGQRGNRQARPAQTMQQIYRACMDKIIPQAKSIKEVTLKIDTDGALRTCYVVPENCMDDCGSGYVVSGILYRQITAAEEAAFAKEAYAEFMK